MKVVIFGSWSIENFREVEQAVEDSGLRDAMTEVVSGNGRGVDALAERYAKKRGLAFKRFSADKWRHGPLANAMRDEAMAAYAESGIAVWDGEDRATARMIERMEGRVFVRRVAAQILNTRAVQEDAVASAEKTMVDIVAEQQNRRLRLTLPWEEIEDSAKEQIEETLRNPHVETLVVLPDVHWGLNGCIGAAVLMRDVIVPSFVGVDIGCGMLHVNTRRTAGELKLLSFEDKKALFRMMQKVIPHGIGKGNKGDAPPYPVVFESAAMSPKERKQINFKARHDWGSLGHGNHFIETGVNAKGEVGLTLHSGSRSPGYTIADYYIKAAAKNNKCAAPFFEIRSELGQAYYHDMLWALDFAAANRLRMAEKLLELLGLHKTELLRIENTHNHAVWDTKSNMVLLRKGATPANAGEYGVIPGSQLDGVYVTQGLGNEHFLCSASHGAGRTMSRGKALHFESNEKFKELMAHVVCRTDTKVQDEAPWAYKNIHTVVNNQVENGQVEVLDYFRPIIVMKG